MLPAPSMPAAPPTPSRGSRPAPDESRADIRSQAGQGRASAAPPRPQPQPPVAAAALPPRPPRSAPPSNALVPAGQPVLAAGLANRGRVPGWQPLSSRGVGRRRLQNILVTAALAPPATSRKRGREEAPEWVDTEGSARAAARRRSGPGLPRPVSATAQRISEALQQLAAQAPPVKAVQPLLALPAPSHSEPPAPPAAHLSHRAAPEAPKPGAEQPVRTEGQRTVRFSETVGPVAAAVRAASKHGLGSKRLAQADQYPFRFSPSTALRDASCGTTSTQLHTNGCVLQRPSEGALPKPTDNAVGAIRPPTGQRSQPSTSQGLPQLVDVGQSRAGAQGGPQPEVSTGAREAEASPSAKRVGNPATALLRRAEADADGEAAPAAPFADPSAAPKPTPPTSDKVHSGNTAGTGEGGETGDASGHKQSEGGKELEPLASKGEEEAAAKSAGDTGGAPVSSGWGSEFLAANKADALAAQAAVADGAAMIMQ
jgi:hypothetical protein